MVTFHCDDLPYELPKTLRMRKKSVCCVSGGRHVTLSSDGNGFFQAEIADIARREVRWTKGWFNLEAIELVLKALDAGQISGKWIDTPYCDISIQNSSDDVPRLRAYTTDGFVYFIQAVQGGLIKIGWAVSPESRLQYFQSFCPVKLCIIYAFPGTRTDENQCHKRFSHHRQRGEWFADCEEIRDFIANMEVAAYVQTK